MRPVPPFFVFDGDCGFCKKWVKLLQGRLPADVTFVPYQDVEDLDRYEPGEIVVRSGFLFLAFDSRFSFLLFASFAA